MSVTPYKVATASVIADGLNHKLSKSNPRETVKVVAFRSMGEANQNYKNLSKITMAVSFAFAFLALAMVAGAALAAAPLFLILGCVALMVGFSAIGTIALSHYLSEKTDSIS